MKRYIVGILLFALITINNGSIAQDPQPAEPPQAGFIAQTLAKYKNLYQLYQKNRANMCSETEQKLLKKELHTLYNKATFAVGFTVIWALGAAGLYYYVSSSNSSSTNPDPQKQPNLNQDAENQKLEQERKQKELQQKREQDQMQAEADRKLKEEKRQRELQEQKRQEEQRVVQEQERLRKIEEDDRRQKEEAHRQREEQRKQEELEHKRIEQERLQVEKLRKQEEQRIAEQKKQEELERKRKEEELQKAFIAAQSIPSTNSSEIKPTQEISQNLPAQNPKNPDILDKAKDKLSLLTSKAKTGGTEGLNKIKSGVAGFFTKDIKNN